MEIQQLRHLIAALHYGSLLKAAEECNISQSGLSRSIRSLEERLGVPLLIRKSKGVEPTPFGANVVHRARIILNEVDRSFAEIRAMQASEVGDVCFGITQNYGFYMLPDVLAEAYEAHPAVRVRVVTGGFLDMVEQLRSGAIDFAFGLLGPIETEGEIVIEPLREHHSRVIARCDHALATKQGEITAEELSKASWATLSGQGFQRTFLEYFSSRGVRAPAQVICTDSIALIRLIVARSDMLAVLPPDIVLEDIKLGELAILDCDAPAEQTQVGLLFRNDAFISPQCAELVERLRARLSAGGQRRAAVQKNGKSATRHQRARSQKAKARKRK